jgi:hypothetical protein
MQNFKVTASADAKSKELKIIFEGDLNLQNTTQIKIALQEGSVGFDTIEISGKEITAIDLSFVQIVEAFRKSETGKKVKVILDLPYDMKTLLGNAGINYPNK